MKFSKRFKRNLPLLKRLKNCRSPQLRMQILRNADVDFLICLIECIVNVLQGRVSIKEGQKRRLLKHAETLRTLSKIRSRQLLRKKLVQSGTGISIIPLILGPVLAAAAGLLGEIIAKNGSKDAFDS